MQLLFQLHQELVDHTQDDFFIERTEADDGIQTVAELRREHPLDIRHFVAGFLLVGEADRALLQTFRTCIRGHHDDHVAEVGLATIVIRQGAMVHDLQQDIENIWMRLFNFVEQQHGMRFLGNRFGQQTALVETDVTRRRANQATDSMTLHVLGHVEANQLDAKNEGQLLCHFGLADTGWTREQERADWLVSLAQTGTCHLDR